MTRLTQAVRSFARQDEGQDLLEYALLVALIALVAVGAVTAAGAQVNAIFGQIAGAISAGDGGVNPPEVRRPSLARDSRETRPTALLSPRWHRRSGRRSS